MLQRPRSRPCHAHTLTEVLVVVAVLAVTSGIAMQTMSGIRSAAQQSRVETNVNTVNSALAAYLSNGGSFSDTTDPHQIISRVKSAMEAEKAKTFLGFTNSFLDRRIQLIELKSTETEWVATFAPYEKRFQTVQLTSGNNPPGPYYKFSIEGSSANDDSRDEKSTDTRRSIFSYAATSDWLWDFRENAAHGREGIIVVPTERPEETILPDTPPERQLKSPHIDIVVQRENSPPPAPRIGHFINLTGEFPPRFPEEDEAGTKGNDSFEGSLNFPMSWDEVFLTFDTDRIFNHFQGLDPPPQGWVLEYLEPDNQGSKDVANWKILVFGEQLSASSSLESPIDSAASLLEDTVYSFRYRRIGEAEHSDMTLIRRWHHFRALEYLYREYGQPLTFQEEGEITNYTISLEGNEDPDLAYLEYNIKSSSDALYESETFDNSSHGGSGSVTVAAKDFPDGVYILGRNAPVVEQDKNGRPLVPSESIYESEK